VGGVCALRYAICKGKEKRLQAMADLVEIAAHGVDVAAPLLRNLLGGEGVNEEALKFEDSDLEFDDSELELWSREEVVERLRALPSGHKLQRVLLPALEGEDVQALTYVSIHDQKIKYEELMSLVWFLRFHGGSVVALLLQDCGLKDKHLVALSYAIKLGCPKLEKLNFDKNKKLRDLGVAALAVTVQELKNVTTAVVMQDCGIVDLKGFIGNKMIFKNRALVRLDLSGNKITEHACEALGAALAENLTLKTLDLHNNRIGDIGLSQILQSLQQNIVLEELMVGQNRITAVSGAVIAEGLSQSDALKALWIQKNKLGDEGMKSLAEGIRGNSSLKVFRLNQNDIGDEGLMALARAIREKKFALSKLFLQDNVISRIDEFCDAILYDQDLLFVNLSRNQLTDNAAFAVGEMLKVNQTLTELFLNGNNISDDGAIVIGEGLKENHSLVILGLSRNNIAHTGAEMLFFVLAAEMNTSLKELDFSENPVSDHLMDEDGWLRRAMQRGATGPSLRVLNINIDGTEIAKDSLNTFGVKIANSETVTRFSIVLLIAATLTNWFDVLTDILVARELFLSAETSELSFAWFVFSACFLILPSLYIAIFMSAPGDISEDGFWPRFQNFTLSLFQARIAKEAYESYRLRETTSRYGSLRVVEVAGESGPQAFLQINFLVYSLTLPSGVSSVNNAAVLVSVALSLLVLGQTFSDLFEKEFVMRKESTNLEGSSLFFRLLPTWIFHICQFSFRAITIALAAAIFRSWITAIFIVFAITLRIGIKFYARSRRRIAFAVLVTFIAQSAWDKRLAVILGIFLSTLEAALVLTAVWLSPNEALTEGEGLYLWARDSNLQNITPDFFTILLSILFMTYTGIFLFYIYPLHEYEEMGMNEQKDVSLVAANDFKNVLGDIMTLKRHPQEEEDDHSHDGHGENDEEDDSIV